VWLSGFVQKEQVSNLPPEGFEPYAGAVCNLPPGGFEIMCRGGFVTRPYNGVSQTVTASSIAPLAT